MTDADRPMEWRCFHCGEAFTNEISARRHFGPDEGSVAACVIKAGAEQGLVGALRQAESELTDAWRAIHNEGTEAARAYYAQQSRHQTQLRLAEESGYEKGLADGRSFSSTSYETAPAADREEHLSEALFALSAKLKASDFLSDPLNHAAYERVVKAFNMPPRARPTVGDSERTAMKPAPDRFEIFNCLNCGTIAPAPCVDRACCNADERDALVEVARLRSIMDRPHAARIEHDKTRNERMGQHEQVLRAFVLIKEPGLIPEKKGPFTSYELLSRFVTEILTCRSNKAEIIIAELTWDLDLWLTTVREWQLMRRSSED